MSVFTVTLDWKSYEVCSLKWFVVQIGELLGSPANKSRKVAKSIFEFEKKIANVTAPPQDHRDVNALYHKMNVVTLTKIAPFVSR